MVEQAAFTVTRGRRFDYGAVAALDALHSGNNRRAEFDSSVSSFTFMPESGGKTK